MKLNIEILRARDQEARVFRADQKKKISRYTFSFLIFSPVNLYNHRMQDKVRSLQNEYRQQQQESNQRRKNLRCRVNKLKAETIASNASLNSNSVTKAQLKMLNKHYAKQATVLINKVKKLLKEIKLIFYYVINIFN